MAKIGAKKKVLIVDDDRDMIKALEARLAKDGFQVSSTTNGEGLPEKCNRLRPSLVILDLNLPKKDGREVLAIIKEDNELKSIPVVVLTTSESEVDILKSYELRANCFVSKPVGFEEFSDVIKQIEGFWFQIVKLPNE